MLDITFPTTYNKDTFDYKYSDGAISIGLISDWTKSAFRALKQIKMIYIALFLEFKLMFKKECRVDKRRH